jgi:adenylate kinase
MIVVTGTPGTGKTSVAQKLGEKLERPVKHANQLVKEKELFTSVEGECLVVDLKALEKELKGFQGIVEGHVLCEMKLDAELVLVLRTEPAQLEKRLEERSYSPSKVRENLEAEALDYCSIKARENYGKVEDVDTTNKTVDQTVSEVIRVMEGQKGDFVDWSHFFLS